MNFRNLFLSIASICAFASMAVPASAEIVFLSSGKTLSVKGHRMEGDSVVLLLRSGGEVTCDKTLIEKIVADEVPHEQLVQLVQLIEPVTPKPAAVGTSGQALAVAPGVLEQTPYGAIIATVSQAHGVDPMLVRALIQVESNYRPRARSSKGAMGLMQLMPATARQYKVRNPYDPTANISAGVKHLKGLIDRMDGAVELALAAYNAGEGAVKKFKGVPPYRETRNYVSKILSLAGIGQ
jgi:hypothetical protein